VINNADRTARSVEVTVRVYDADGDQVGSYTDEIDSVAPDAEAELFVDVFADPGRVRVVRCRRDRRRLLRRACPAAAGRR